MEGSRIAGAPISWGISEVTGWGYQMGAGRVFTEMADVGFRATEAGPKGFLPNDAPVARRTLEDHGLRLVGGFAPVVLHDAGPRPLAEIARAASWLAAAGGDVLAIAADCAEIGYERRLELTTDEWRRLLANLNAAVDVAGEHDVAAVLHPHAGTAVQRGPEVRRVLENSTIPLCLDTGHQLIGGIDPLDLVEAASDRIGHVHLKDVAADLAEQVSRGRASYAEAVRNGMYRPLGEGDIDVRAVVRRLRDAGFDGWYVLEQDVVLDTEPQPMEGPMRSARESLNYIKSILTGAGDASP